MRVLSLPTTLLLATFAVLALTSESCCKKRGVSDKCAKELCNANSPPDDFERYSLFEAAHNCTKHLLDVSICLADGRDSSNCCVTEARDKDENACFSMCKGQIPQLTPTSWTKFQTCLVINTPTIYSCFEEGYKSLPSAPRDLKITRQGDKALVTWTPPEKNADMVVTYRVAVGDSSGVTRVDTTADTKTTQHTIESLKTNGRYSVYVIAMTKDQNLRSLSSNIAYFSTEQKGEIEPANALLTDRSQVFVPRDAKSITLACRLRATESDTDIEWEKKDSSGNFHRLTGSRYQSHAYLSGDVHPVFLSAITINSLTSDDFGQYRCKSKSEMPDSALVDLIVSNVLKAPPTPPETPLECCQKKYVRPHCSSICTQGTERRAGVKPGAFLPQYRCVEEMINLMQCTLSEARAGSCCVREAIPHQCLSLCDRDIALKEPVNAMCLQYFDTILDCHDEAFSVRPRAVDGVRMNGDRTSMTVEWDETDTALGYHVYYRRNGASWKVQTVNRPSAKLNDVDEVAIVSANHYGISGAVRISYQDNSWASRVD